MKCVHVCFLAVIFRELASIKRLMRSDVKKSEMAFIVTLLSWLSRQHFSQRDGVVGGEHDAQEWRGLGSWRRRGQL
jgi:hypothetical protein